MTTEGQLLWAPTPAVKEAANLTKYARWLAETRNLRFDDYHALWTWSVNDLPAFWQSVWDFFEVHASQRSSTPLANTTMPGAQWFVGARLNYAENIFRKMPVEGPAIYYRAEQTAGGTLSRHDLERQVAALAATMRRLGIVAGDRVAAYMPNIPHTIVAFLASASLGAIWSSCSPDFGSRSVLDRFSQIEPKLLIAVDGYVYGGKRYDRLAVVRELQASLPGLQQTILLSRLEDTATAASALTRTISWNEAVGDLNAPLSFEQVPFEHPLWILYTSGTTGLPKAVVQGHGGILLEHLKAAAFHSDLGAGDRFLWYTSTGWMMWNFLVGGLLSGCSIVLYDGSPSTPDLNVLWELAAETGVTYFGTSAAFINACHKAGLTPNAALDLSKIRAIGSTGSPLGVAGFDWVYAYVNSTLALESMSGGTDVCTGFVGGIRTQPIYAGEIQGAFLGANVHAFDEQGAPIVNEVGELVVTAPLPSMPLYFWNDPGMERYKASYFDVYPGVWRHGDWITFNDRGGCVIYGRSDSTIKRHGVRLGTSEIYQAVESLPEIQDSLVIDLEMLGRESFMALFVVLRASYELTDELRQRIADVLRREVSPRHVPDEIVQIAEVPYTLSGKKMEVPIRKILLGMNADKTANPGAMRNPSSMDFFRRFAMDLRKREQTPRPD